MQKEQLLEAILEQQKAVHKDGWNVATSQRWVNQYKSQQYATSRRQCEFCLLIIKSKKGCRFGGIGDRTNQGTEIRAAVTTTLKNSP